jgi:hypothetical protein
MDDQKPQQPMRMKYWKELNQEEKIGRMREQVKELKFILSRQAELVEKLLSHTHNQTGEIVTKLDRNSQYSGNVIGGFTGSNSDETYF